MGLFSMYTGLIYNDIFSKSLNIFGSYWKVSASKEDIMKNDHTQLTPYHDDWYGSPYPLGLDPIWQMAENKIIFQNAYKMKISIIIGVFHMLFGVCLSLWNHM